MWMRLAASMVLMASVQAPAPPEGATLTLVQRATEPLYFSNPALGMKGTIRPIPGSRLEMVVIAVGDAPIVEVDIRQFALISADGVLYEPIAAGGGPDLIFPIDSLPLGREMGQILPNDAQVLMKRISTTSVMLEADPRATLAFVFQLPARSATRAFRLPGGSELALTR
jgi:hypothetical protein